MVQTKQQKKLHRQGSTQLVLAHMYAPRSLKEIAKNTQIIYQLYKSSTRSTGGQHLSRLSTFGWIMGTLKNGFTRSAVNTKIKVLHQFINLTLGGPQGSGSSNGARTIHMTIQTSFLPFKKK